LKSSIIFALQKSKGIASFSADHKKQYYLKIIFYPFITVLNTYAGNQNLSGEILSTKLKSLKTRLNRLEKSTDTVKNELEAITDNSRDYNHPIQ
jgi:hypothetical protein